MSNQKKLDLVHTRAEKYLDTPISAVARKVWDVPVLRGGKNISALQELADCKTGIQRLEAAVAALTSLVGQLATGRDIDYDRIKSDTREVLANGVNVTVSLDEKDAA